MLSSTNRCYFAKGCTLSREEAYALLGSSCGSSWRLTCRVASESQDAWRRVVLCSGTESGAALRHRDCS
eukprot:1151981-Pelagomonas_calceolata.AAC.2